MIKSKKKKKEIDFVYTEFKRLFLVQRRKIKTLKLYITDCIEHHRVDQFLILYTVNRYTNYIFLSNSTIAMCVNLTEFQLSAIFRGR